MLTIPHVELPTMPGASDHRPAELAFAKRTALMRADAIKCMKVAVVSAKKRHDFPGNHQFVAATG